MRIFGWNISLRQSQTATAKAATNNINPIQMKRVLQNESLKALAGAWRENPSEAVDFGRQIMGLKKPNIEDIVYANALQNDPELQRQLATNRIAALGIAPKKSWMEEFAEAQGFMARMGLAQPQQKESSGFAALLNPENIGALVGILQMVMENAKSNSNNNGRQSRTTVRDIDPNELQERRREPVAPPRRSTVQETNEAGERVYREEYSGGTEQPADPREEEPALDFDANRLLRTYIFRLADIINDPNISPEQAALSAINGLESIGEIIHAHDPNNKIVGEIFGTLQLPPGEMLVQLNQLAALFKDDKLTAMVNKLKTDEGNEYLFRFHNEVTNIVEAMNSEEEEDNAS